MVGGLTGATTTDWDAVVGRLRRDDDDDECRRAPPQLAACLDSKGRGKGHP